MNISKPFSRTTSSGLEEEEEEDFHFIGGGGGGGGNHLFNFSINLNVKRLGSENKVHFVMTS